MKFNLSYGWMCGLILFVACDTPQVEQSADLTVPVTVQPVASVSYTHLTLPTKA